MKAILFSTYLGYVIDKRVVYRKEVENNETRKKGDRSYENDCKK